MRDNYSQAIVGCRAATRCCSELAKELLEEVLARLHGLTSNEVLKGAIPDKHRYKKQVAEARQKRTAMNQQVSCLLTC